MKPTEADEAVLEGVIIPIAWGPLGAIEGVGLVTFDEAEYRIDPGIAWEHFLRGYLRQRVRLSAALRGNRVIEIKSVEVLPGAARRVAR